MNYFITKLRLGSIMILLVTIAFLSFRERPGGESFTAYVNDKMVLQHYFGYDKNIKTLNLSNTSPNDQLRMHYNHCGKIGTDRKISLVNKNEKVIKSWTFANTQEDTSPYMTVKMKNLTAAIGQSEPVKLYYFSSEISEGRLLATVLIDDGAKASR
jgi:hypothetical protein